MGNVVCHWKRDILDNELWGKMMEPFSPKGEESEDDNKEGSQPGEDNLEEGVKPMVKKDINLPSKEEVRKHMVNHIPVRSWCEHCVKGRCGGNRHSRKDVASGEREPVVSIDYMFMNDNQQEGEEKGMPIIVVKDRTTRIIRSRFVPQKGHIGYAVKVVSGILESLGHSKLIFKSDQEPAILSLKDAVKSESRIDIVMEEFPEYESKSNGEVERAIQMVQGQIRTMKDRLESRYGQRIGGEHPCLPWLIAHASDTMNRFHVYSDGKSAYDKWKGRPFRGEYRESGENVLHLSPGTQGRTNLRSDGKEALGMALLTERGRQS